MIEMGDGCARKANIIRDVRKLWVDAVWPAGLGSQGITTKLTLPEAAWTGWVAPGD
jgi:hypothetical protein